MDRIYDYEKAVNSIMGSTPDPEIYESIKLHPWMQGRVWCA